MSRPDYQLIPDFLTKDEHDRYLRDLQSVVSWQQDEIAMYGRTIRVPRLTAWYGDEGVCYRYSGTTHRATGWLAPLDELRRRIETAAQSKFNSVLLNRYRDGSDSVAWHADDEPELGPEPTIASLSLGSTRRFQFRRKNRDAASERQQPISLELPGGSLLLMLGSTQTQWMHQIPKTKRPVLERINLTFRYVYAS